MSWVMRDCSSSLRSDSMNKENIQSRAYIAFKDEELLATFSREYDGHVFRDKAGKSFPTYVLTSLRSLGRQRVYRRSRICAVPEGPCRQEEG